MQIKVSKNTLSWNFKSDTKDKIVVFRYILSKMQGTFKLNYFTIRTFDTYFEQFFKDYLNHVILLRIIAKFKDTIRCKGLFGTLLFKYSTICNNGSQENLQIEFNYLSRSKISLKG